MQAKLVRQFQMVKKDRCELCGCNSNLTTHHIMNGAYRKKSEEYGGVMTLCFGCHRKVHDSPEVQKALKQRYQARFELLYSHEKWMELFHKNYLERNEEDD